MMLKLTQFCALALLCSSVAACSSEPLCADRCDRAGDSGAGMGGTGGMSGATSAGAMAGQGGVGGAPLTTPLPAGACKPAGATAPAKTLHATDRMLAPKVAVRRETMYVADPTAGIYRLEASGTMLERVVASHPADFLVADLNVYYLESGGLKRASLTATDDMPASVGMLASDMVRLVGFDEMHLYVVEGGASITSVPTAGGEGERLVTSTIGDAKMRAGLVYYADRTAMQVMRVPVDGGSPKAMTTAKFAAIGAVDADADQIYFADAHVIYAVPEDVPAMPRAIAVSGLAAAGREGPVRRLQLVGDRLFFADDANVGWVATDGSACGLVIAGAAQQSAGWDATDDALYANRPAASGSGRELVRFDL